MSDGDWVYWGGVFTHRVGFSGGGGDGIDYFYSLSDLTKDNVVFGKILVLMHDEELRAVGVRSGVGHGNSTTKIFTSEGFVCKLVSWSTCTGTSRITALDHEAIDGAVEDGVGVKVIFGEIDKIIDGDGSVLRIKSNDDVTFGGF